MKLKLIRKVIPVFLLTLFVGYYASILSFTHMHIVNGVMIVHSHPSSSQDHTHTTSELVLIAHLASFETLKAESIHLSVFNAPFVHTIGDSIITPHVQPAHLLHVVLRGPPHTAFNRS